MDVLIILFVGFGSIVIACGVALVIIKGFIWLIEELEYRRMQRASKRITKHFYPEGIPDDPE